ncbi:MULTISPECIES: DUF6376 family protein [unclassified Bacillus (in: firmicutes)]|uniref:DUF6376 family protein n=1 Tax=unclassified Bacillus (in: firmicutes) TaxID=185979 RepID=UPI0008E73E3E|nr:MULTISPECIES: DUF6376 family protein [unclassified Bacillus (in: firmicutes)]SFA72162.1 hypothetical protein SAMN02799634_101272 [Bacillus sp. UNCCL13]SFQ62409.1 hypothetical protein SAMN04488577_0552 [Bacillus sp. cl95]
MKKILLILIVMQSLLLSACSLLGEVNDSLEYVNKTTEHINLLSDFAEQAPQLIQNAAQDDAARKELENQLMDVKASIEEFIATEDIPAVAKDIHAELVTKNEELLDQINQVIENGHIALDKLENSEIITTINNVQGLLSRLEQLGL